jgi:hypothetical protein
MKMKTTALALLTRTTACTAVGLLVIASSADAGLLAYEGFDYTAGSSNLDTVGSGGSGWNGGWTNITNDGADVVSGSLVPTGASSGLASTGSSMLQNSQSRIGRFLDTSAGGAFGAAGYLNGANDIGADGKTLYLSVLFQSNTDDDNFYEFEFHKDALGDGGRIGGVGNDVNNSSNFHLRAPNTTNTAIGPANTDVNFFVIRIDYKAGNDDIRVYMNPALGVEPGVPTLTALAQADMSFDGFAVGAFLNGATLAIDEIRVGETYADVTPVPEPGSLVLLGLGGLLIGTRRRRA